MALVGQTKVGFRRDFLGGPGQRRSWLSNRVDGVRAVARGVLAPGSYCGSTHEHMVKLSCDKKRGHKGNHMDRRWVARMKPSPRLIVCDRP